ncbi:PEP-CTERM sorting domain-containing protein [Brasilonema sp. UFV-L1]|uniref:PEP-CTERM sorting domain-containing protein n=1 Tax=Brasilonema sp. UFV-L1 TaxID=2234130 RepID=UPI00145CB266|nr:PEP-CTERM sorting domain-containing protein [Brasilonema sp. UFV-L1]NMG09908.1 hypothetical protein [Brasilonema sp. UFV-L1]
MQYQQRLSANNLFVVFVEITEMALLKKLSMAAATSVAAFLSLGTLGSNPAQAALFKYSFEGEGASGYFIYDTDTVGYQPLNTDYLRDYDGSVTEYSVTFQGDTGEITETGKRGTQSQISDEARTVVFISRPGNIGYDGNNEDDFIFYIPKALRDGQYGLSVRFSYPEGTFPSGDANTQPTSFPSTVRARAYPYWDFPNSTGDAAFDGTVSVRVEKIPEPASSLAFLVVGGALFILYRRQRKSAVPQENS